MLPLSVLRAASNREVLVELTNGDTYNGKLVSSDSYMNMTLQEVIFTSRTGNRFFQMKECYIRGCTIKCIRVEKEVLDNIPKEEQNSRYNKAKVHSKKNMFGERRGEGGNRGRGRGRGRGTGRGTGRS
ncbi:hypothetical protein WA538_003268 [Blastocystis sp. DL]